VALARTPDSGTRSTALRHCHSVARTVTPPAGPPAEFRQGTRCRGTAGRAGRTRESRADRRARPGGRRARPGGRPGAVTRPVASDPADRQAHCWAGRLVSLVPTGSASSPASLAVPPRLRGSESSDWHSAQAGRAAAAPRLRRGGLTRRRRHGPAAPVDGRASGRRTTVTRRVARSG
jgi:hypothetical protein